MSRAKIALSTSEQTFVLEYLTDPMRNKSKAAIRAGYAEKGATAQACQLMKRPIVQAAIAAGLVEQQARLDVMAEKNNLLKCKADDVVLEMVRMAMFDPGDLVHVKTLDDIKELPEDVRRAITGWKWDRDGRLVLQLGKEKAIEMLGRHHGLFNDKLDVRLLVGLAERMREMEG
jgi:phage terminase small subunit